MTPVASQCHAKIGDVGETAMLLPKARPENVQSITTNFDVNMKNAKSLQFTLWCGNPLLNRGCSAHVAQTNTEKSVQTSSPLISTKTKGKNHSKQGKKAYFDNMIARILRTEDKDTCQFPRKKRNVDTAPDDKPININGMGFLF